MTWHNSCISCFIKKQTNPTYGSKTYYVNLVEKWCLCNIANCYKIAPVCSCHLYSDQRLTRLCTPPSQVDILQKWLKTTSPPKKIFQMLLGLFVDLRNIKIKRIFTWIFRPNIHYWPGWLSDPTWHCDTSCPSWPPGIMNCLLYLSPSQLSDTIYVICNTDTIYVMLSLQYIVTTAIPRHDGK